MSVLSKLSGTLQTTFQIGKAGPKVKNNGGVIEARNAADAAYANIKADQVQGTTALLNAAIQLKDDGSGNLKVRDAGDANYKKIFALDPLTGDTQGLVTVNYFNTNASTSAAQIRAYSVKSPYTGAPAWTGSVTIPDNAIITRCVVDVVSALQDSVPSPLTITVGTDEAGQAARFQGTGDNDTQTTGTYETTPFLTMKTTGSGSTQKFLITASGTPASGQVNVYIEYLVPQAL